MLYQVRNREKDDLKWEGVEKEKICYSEKVLKFCDIKNRTVYTFHSFLVCFSQPADWKRINLLQVLQNMEEEKASTPNKGKDIYVGSSSGIEMATNPDYYQKREREKAKDILAKLDSEVKQMSFKRNVSECCIYRVPEPLRNVNSKAYSPLLISIGPLNRENTERAMEKEKLKYFKKLTERAGMDKKKIIDILISIENQEERLRHCYSEKFKSMRAVIS